MELSSPRSPHTTITKSMPPTATMSPGSDDEYETAFDKLQRMQRRLAHPDSTSNNAQYTDNSDDVTGYVEQISQSIRTKRRTKAYGASSLEKLDDVDIEFDDEEYVSKKSMFSGFDDMSNGDSDADNTVDDENEADDASLAHDEIEEHVGRSKGRKNSVIKSDNVASIDNAVVSEKEEIDVEYTKTSGYEIHQDDLRTDHTSIASERECDDEKEKTGMTAAYDEMKDTEKENETSKNQASFASPSETELYPVVDAIFQAADKNTMTVKQVNKSVAAHFHMEKVTKDMKGLIKERLTKLVSGEISIGSNHSKTDDKKPSKRESEEDFQEDSEEEEEVNYDTSSDYDEAADPKKSKRKARMHSDDDASLSETSTSQPRRRGKMAQHIRNHATKLRARQLEESRIRQEELKNITKSEEEGPKLSEEDRMRAQAIAERFDTNREEELIKREEDRVGLIGVLRKKRLDIITLENNIEGISKDEMDTKKEAESTVMIDLEDDETESDEEDDELDIVTPAVTVLKKPSALECLMAKPGDNAALRVQHNTKPKQAANSRFALRNALRAKQVKAGNRWLARELGYKTEEEHIRECMEVELKKRKQILFLEQQAALHGNNELGASNPAFAVSVDEKTATTADDDEEEDEELAMAKQLEDSEVKSESTDDVAQEEIFDQMNVEGNDDEYFAEHDRSSDNQLATSDEVEPTAEKSSPSSSPKKVITSLVSPSNSRENPVCNDSFNSEAIQNEINETETFDNHDGGVRDERDRSKSYSPVTGAAIETSNVNGDDVSDEVGDSSSETKTKSNKPKNSAWKEMLRIEKEMLAKQKKIQKKGGALVEGEAEEEEEEEGIVGLEDFGFSVEKKKGDDDESDDDVDADEDDLEHVVDDLSDDEGDEEAGETARKQLEAREEKERHKEIMRRMREGYDGRRGGIASGVGGARGIHRFDQLVAADNREDAKRLGLLNEDEMDSDDEENEMGEAKSKKDSADDDDEAALLDKMLKERFLNRDEDDILEENFTDDDEDDDADEEQANGDNLEDEEEKEQDRLAKQFAKRARMNRILEAFEGDTEFSRSRLIDEDASMQIDLKTMKVGLFKPLRTTHTKKRGSVYSESNSNLVSLFKRQKSVASDAGEDIVGSKASNFTSQEGSLSLALLASRSVGRKRKTTFLSGKQNSSFSRQNSSSNKSISLGHVVFVTGESQSASQFSTSASNLSKNTSKKTSPKLSASSSLWNRAISKNWSGK